MGPLRQLWSRLSSLPWPQGDREKNIFTMGLLLGLLAAVCMAVIQAALW